MQLHAKHRGILAIADSPASAGHHLQTLQDPTIMWGPEITDETGNIVNGTDNLTFTAAVANEQSHFTGLESRQRHRGGTEAISSREFIGHFLVANVYVFSPRVPPCVFSRHFLKRPRFSKLLCMGRLFETAPSGCWV